MAEQQRIDPAAYVDFQRSMWVSLTGAGATPSYEAIEAMLVFDQALVDDAVSMFESMSEEVYIERGLGQWKRDLSRHANQLDLMRRTAIKAARADKFTDVDRDFVRPFLDGVWGEWVAKNYADEPGGRPPQNDPVFPPSAGLVEQGGAMVWKTKAYAAESASLWNQAYVAWSFDREMGSADRLGIIFTDVASQLERAAPGEDPTVLDKAEKIVRDAGDALAEGASNLLETVGSGALEVARWVGIGGAIYLGVRYGVPALRRAFGRKE